MTRIRAAAIIVFVALACGLAWVVALPLWPVSYTHLTLPTICSV